MPTYGGDEVNAVVLDIGSNTTRAGYAGEDTPKVVIPTSYGYIPRQENMQESEEKYFFGDNGPNIWRSKMEIKNPIKDSIIQDWNSIEKFINFIFDHEMRLGLTGAELELNERRGLLTEHPLIVTEPSWNTKENRERMIEIAFEELDTPAYYSVDRAVMSAFAAGKGTAMVVDIGDDLTTVTPICDGFVMRKGIQKSLIGGNLLTKLILSKTEKKLPTPIYPNFLIESKPLHYNTNLNKNLIGFNLQDIPFGVKLHQDRLLSSESESSEFGSEMKLNKFTTTKSFLNFQKLKLIHDIKETVFEVFPRTWDEEVISSIPPRTFEFPTGQLLQYGRERYAIPEMIFNPNNELCNQELLILKQQQENIKKDINYLPISKLILESILNCDLDIQSNLNSNIIVTGSSSLIPGLLDRLDFDLKNSFNILNSQSNSNSIGMGSQQQPVKFKIFSPGNLVERKFSSWLGASILASLGSFHQLWIGKDEYKEQGRSIVHRRCK